MRLFSINPQGLFARFQTPLVAFDLDRCSPVGHVIAAMRENIVFSYFGAIVAAEFPVYCHVPVHRTNTSKVKASPKFIGLRMLLERFKRGLWVLVVLSFPRSSNPPGRAVGLFIGLMRFIRPHCRPNLLCFFEVEELTFVHFGNCLPRKEQANG